MVRGGAILFDFDGTLVDTREPSWALFSETNALFELGIESREAFFAVFEGNFFESLARMCPDRDKAQAAKEHFLNLLRTRYHPTVIPGMVDVIKSLSPSYTLAVLSSNTIEAIRRALVEADVATCFSHVFAGDVEPSKTASIGRFLADQTYATLRQCSPSYDNSAPTELVMDQVFLVTDTVGDVVEARRCGIRAIGVAWGMHGERELTAAGAERVALWPQELLAWLGVEVGGGLRACGVGTPAEEPSVGGDPGDPGDAPRGPWALRRQRHVETRLHARVGAGLVATKAPTGETGELRRALASIVASNPGGQP